jgi:SET domain-containing protein
MKPGVKTREGKIRSPKLFIARSKLHGLGLFAGEDIEWGRRLIEYEGQHLSSKEVRRRQRFYDSVGFTCLMEFGDGSAIDGLFGGNESRFINHSSQPNVGALREDMWRIVFYSLNDIAKGEELTFDYGFDPKKTARLANVNSTLEMPPKEKSRQSAGRTSK